MYITYQITHIKSNKYYIGKTSLKNWDDGYMGKGNLIRRAVRKHGRKAFTRTILSTFNTEEEAYADEAKRVTIKEVEDPNCYNLIVGGSGFFSGSLNPNYGKPKTKSHRAKLSKARKTRVTKQSTRNKLSASLIGSQRALGSKHTQKWKDNNSKLMQGNNYVKNSKHYYSVYTLECRMFKPHQIIPAGFIPGRPNKCLKNLMKRD